MLRTLLRLQELDLRIELLAARELEIPKQKGKFEIHRERLTAELEERRKVCHDLKLEQREVEGEIDQMQTHVDKYETQLYAVRKNEEYQALLHEIDMLKKQVGLKEERIITIMMGLDDAQARLEEDKNRIEGELREIDAQCDEVDSELDEAIAERKGIESQCEPLKEQVAPDLLRRYKRVRKNKETGAVVVPLNDEVCSGCNMAIPAQIVNEVLAGEKTHACVHCGRILYYRENVR